jgi:signal transduction histidine kinase
MLKVETDRPIYKQGNIAMIYFTGCVVITGVILSGLIVFLLESVVISRLSRLHDSVEKIGRDENRSGRVPTEGNDELTELARSINETLDALETSQKKLEDINAKYRSVNEELETRVAARTAELENVNKALSKEIADHRAAETDLIRARAQAELYLDLMGHDINNLNQIALGYLELAQDERAMNLSSTDLIDKPVEALKSSTRLINNVRKLQRATEGRTVSTIIDLGAILSQISEEYSTVAGRSVTIRYEPKTGCMVYADELLAEVFSNLIGNAIKHSQGPVLVDLSLTCHEDGGKEYYVVAVEDNGPGIPDSVKGILFSRIKKDQNVAAGKGLGLYLVRTLVNSYGGKVWVEDRIPGEPPKGCRFVVMLPAAAGPSASAGH